MQCVILAGGLASRMRPITETIPKSLISVGAHPFIYYQLHWLKKHGVTEVVLSVGYKGEMIEEYVGDGRKWDLKVRYVNEGVNLRGTGGALRFALEQGVLQDSFLMLYGDSFLPIDFAEVWKAFSKTKKPALMTVYKNLGLWDTSNVWFERGKIRLYDKFHQHQESRSKLQFIDYGLSAFTKKAIEELIPKEGKSDLAELFYALSLKGQLSGFEAKTRFYEIGSPSGLEDFRQYIEKTGEKPTSSPVFDLPELSLN